MSAPVRKIAIHHSFPGKGESESAARIAIAAGRIGLEARIVVDPAEIPPFAPDLVLCLSHHEGKTSPYPTYGVMLVPRAWYLASTEALQRVLGYDGYLTTSAPTADWLSALTQAFDGRPARIASYLNTLPATPSPSPVPPPALAAPKLAYIGSNWDGWRGWELFNRLAQEQCLRCHGPAEAWRHIDPAARGGPVPFDGHSVLEVYRAAGAGLGLDRPDFVAEDLPSVRVFEITAASAAAIMGDLPFLRRAFGDSVWYFDTTAPAAVAAWQIQRHLAGITADPAAAWERVQAAHAIFNRDFALERLLPNLLALHRQVMADPRPRATAAEALAFCQRWRAAALGQPEAAADTRPLELVQDLTARLTTGSGRVETDPLPRGLSAALELHLSWSETEGRAEAGRPVGRLTLTARGGGGDGGGTGGAPLVVALRPERMSRVGEVRRLAIPLDAIPAAGQGLTLELWPAPGVVLEVLGLGLRLSGRGRLERLARIADSGGAVWLYGAGEGGRRLATALAAAPRFAGFIDDFQPGPVLGHPVRPLAAAIPLLRPDDAVVIASQHWPSLWPRLAGLPPGRLYTAHPDYGQAVIRLPLWPSPLWPSSLWPA